VGVGMDPKCVFIKQVWIQRRRGYGGGCGGGGAKV